MRPKTKFPNLFFSILMVVLMVYCMILYNLALESGLTYTTFANAFWGMWCEVIAAFITQRYIASPAVKKLVFRLLKPDEDKPIFITKLLRMRINNVKC